MKSVLTIAVISRDGQLLSLNKIMNGKQIPIDKKKLEHLTEKQVNELYKY